LTDYQLNLSHKTKKNNLETKKKNKELYSEEGNCAQQLAK